LLLTTLSIRFLRPHPMQRARTRSIIWGDVNKPATLPPSRLADARDAQGS
jgi:hypothetical protein